MAFVELFALCGIAFVQPTFDVLRRNTIDTFVAAGSGRFQVIAVMLTVLLVPPLVLYAIELLVGLASAKARPFAHAALTGAVAGLIAFQVLNGVTSLGLAIRLPLAVVVGILAAIAMLRVSVAHTFVRFLAIAPVIFTVFFVFSAQVSPIVVSSSPSAADVPVKRPARVVQIVLDEFSLQWLLDGHGHIDAQLFPNFAKLAAGSTWYRNATSVAPATQVAVPAILTGRYPDNPRAIPTASVYPENLFTLLGDTYNINAHENLESLNPGGDAGANESLPKVLHRTYNFWKRTVEHYHPPTTIEPEITSFEQPAMRSFVQSLGNAKERQLDHLHVLLPHATWHLLPDGRSYTESTNNPGLGTVWEDVPQLAELGLQRYLLQVQAADRWIGRIVDKLKREGAYDDSLIVLTADHGVAFTAGAPLRKATADNYEQILWVPLMIKAPHQQQGVVDDRLAQTIDVLPTIADTLGVHIPWKVDGQSLLGKPRPNGPRRFLITPSPDMQALPAEAKYTHYDGVKGFQHVLQTRAAASNPDPTLRIYGANSEFSDLVGREATSVQQSTAPPLAGGIPYPGRYAAVDPGAAEQSWTYLNGHLTSRDDRTLAISVNGVIGGIARTYDDPLWGGATFFVVLPPRLFHAGANQVDIFAVSGTPGAPVLRPVGPTG